MKFSEEARICVKCKHNISWYYGPLVSTHVCQSEGFFDHVQQDPVTGDLILPECETVNPSGECKYWEAKPQEPKQEPKPSWVKRWRDRR